MTPTVVPSRFHPGHPAVASATRWAEGLDESQARDLLRDLAAEVWPGDPRHADTLRQVLSGQAVTDVELLGLSWQAGAVKRHKRGWR